MVLRHFTIIRPRSLCEDDVVRVKKQFFLPDITTPAVRLANQAGRGPPRSCGTILRLNGRPSRAWPLQKMFRAARKPCHLIFHSRFTRSSTFIACAAAGAIPRTARAVTTTAAGSAGPQPPGPAGGVPAQASGDQGADDHDAGQRAGAGRADRAGTAARSSAPPRNTLTSAAVTSTGTVTASRASGRGSPVGGLPAAPGPDRAAPTARANQPYRVEPHGRAVAEPAS